MAEKWTADIVGKLHLNGITRRELASELGVTAQYVTMVLNGKRPPAGMGERMEQAICNIVEQRKAVAG